MADSTSKMISLGFTNNRVPVGTHICQIYIEEDERCNALLNFLASGLKSGERAVCFSEKASESVINHFFAQNNLSYLELCRQGALTLAGTRKVYFKDNRFDPNQMLERIKTLHTDAIRSGYQAARVIGEMLPEVQDLPGGNRLLEYESRISLLLRDFPVTSVCQYDARSFDGATIMDIMKVHPHVVIKGAVVNNPFFIPPEEFLK